MTIKLKGQLEIDKDRGVIYFHSNKGFTILRMCGLPKPIPTILELGEMLDITMMDKIEGTEKFPSGSVKGALFSWKC